MAIDFTLTDDQRKLQLEARDFAENVLAPVVREADARPGRVVARISLGPRASAATPVVARAHARARAAVETFVAAAVEFREAVCSADRRT